MTGVVIKVDGLDRMIDDFDRLAKTGLARAASKMDEHLVAGFAESQSLAHVRSGRTKASGVVTSSMTPGEWEGQIEYGIAGAEHQTGAVYELAAGGEHDDFFTSLDKTGEQIGEVLDKLFRETFER